MLELELVSEEPGLVASVAELFPEKRPGMYGSAVKMGGLPMVCPCPIDYGLVMFKSIFEMGLNGFGQFCPWTKRAGQIWTLESIIREKLG